MANISCYTIALTRGKHHTKPNRKKLQILDHTNLQLPLSYTSCIHVAFWRKFIVYLIFNCLGKILMLVTPLLEMLPCNSTKYLLLFARQYGMHVYNYC